MNPDLHAQSDTTVSQAPVSQHSDSECDGLTGVLLRSAFLRDTEALAKRAPSGALLLVYADIDKFSAVNERYGHAAGDELLCRFARRIRQVQGVTPVVCRISADRFAFIMHNLPAHVDELSSSYHFVLDWLTPAIEVTVCAGFYVVDEPDLPADVMLDRAILAHGSVKGDYRKPYAYYTHALSRARYHDTELALDMHRALTEKQFIVHLQPQYSLTDGGLIGAEALVRWQHPEKGLLMPDAFISLFERSGFISQMDHYVWRRVCDLLRRWLDADKRVVPVAVNISRVDLFTPGLADRLEALIREFRLPPNLLKLEITESACTEDPRALIDVVTAFHAKGFTVAMDDFGSGYSSLNTLKDVPVDVLKLDMRFLGGDDTAGRGGSIINSVIRMAKWLSLPVIAEGVETSQQAAFLQSIGCDAAQGYLYAKPISEAAFEQLLTSSTISASAPPALETNLPDPDVFWNPDSLETLIFNSYVGGAAIIEYAHGNVELMRFNERYLRMFSLGFEDADRLRMTLTLLPEADAAIYLDMLERAIQTGQETLAITRRIPPGKTIDACIYLRTRARVLAKIQMRNLIYIAVEDVTAEHVAQAKLRESQEILLAAVTHAKLYYWVYDMAHDSALQGELGQEDVGLPNVFENYPQSLIDTGYIHPDSVAPYLELYQRLKAGAKQGYVDIRCHAASGGYEWRRIRYSVIPDDDGVSLRAIGTSESLDAYKHLEARYLTATMQNGILVWHYHIRTGELHFDTQADIDVSEESGASPIWMSPEAFFAGIHPEDRPALDALHDQLNAGCAFASCFVRCKTQSSLGQWLWYRVIYTPSVDKDGRSDVAVGTAVNITFQMLLQNRYQDALSQFRSLETDQCLGIIRFGADRITINLPTGQAQDYEAFLNEWTSHIPDAAQQRAARESLSANALLTGYADGVSHATCEYRLCTRDGDIRWVATTARLITDSDTLAPTAFIYTRDINRARMAQDVFRQVVCSDYSFITAVDPVHGSYEMYVTDPNDAYSPPEYGGCFSDAVRDFAQQSIHPDDRQNYIDMLALSDVCKRLDAQGPFSFRYRSLDDAGRYRLQRLSVCYIDPFTRHVCIASRRDDAGSPD